MINLNLTPATRWGLNIVALLGGVIALRLGETIFIPTVIAVLLAALLWPAAAWLCQKVHLPWTIACMVAVSVLVLLNVLITLGFILAVTKIMQDIPNPNVGNEADQQILYTKFRTQLERVSPVPLDENYFPKEAEKSRIFQYVKETLKGSNVAEALLKMARYANEWIWQWVLIIFVLLFLLLEGKMLTQKVVEIFGTSLEVQQQVGEALADMARQVRTYLVWRTIVNFFLAIVVGVVYEVVGLKQAWTWALLTGVLCYIPYIGPIVAGVPPIIDAFISCPSPWYSVAVLGFYLCVITLEGYVVVPVVMGRSMELNATTVMLACLFWDLVWGTPGLFLAMPLMAAIKAICFHVPGMRPWANLMSTNELEAPAATAVPKGADLTINEGDLEELAKKKKANGSSHDK